MRLPVNYLLPLAASIFLTGCLGGGGDPVRSTALAAPTGPAADYPVVVGEPFTIGATTYTPEDRLNYDAVGYAMVGQGEGTRVAASHKTLPLPSYVEVTGLENGRTALVRVETRGPMQNDKLIELTPAAAAQLGIIASSAPVRVRRVNPAEVERAMLRAGEQAPLRIDTPMPLVAVLKRKLDVPQPVVASAIAAIDPDVKADKPAPSTPQTPLAATPSPIAKPPAPAQPAPVPQPVATPTVAATKAPPAQVSAPSQAGSRHVQVGAFSTRERAETAAKPLNANVTPAGKFWLVRMGPFNSPAETAAALEKARKSGYRDAIVRRID